MFKVSIIGCGWLGKKTARFLSQSGYAIKGSATSQQSLQSLAENEIDGYLIKISDNIENSVIYPDFFKSDILIISLKPNRREDDTGYFESQINTLAQLAKQNGVKKVIFWSSTSVYGDNNSIVNEESEANPTRPSGKSLIKAEQTLLNQKDFTSIALRLGGLIGYDRNPIQTIKLKRKAGSLYVPVNLVHADDVLQLTKKVIEETQNNSIFNVVADAHPLRINYYKKALNELEVTPESFEIENSNSFKIVDNSKVKKELDYTFLVSNPEQIYSYRTL